jgi:hypothetical protein
VQAARPLEAAADDEDEEEQGRSGEGTHARRCSAMRAVG